MNSNIIIAIVIFLITYALILSEKLHRAVVALAGGMLVVILGVIENPVWWSLSRFYTYFSN